MRLIDADKLKAHYAWWPENERTVLDQIVDAQPTVDAVPVVRCADCEHSDWYTTVDGRRLCYCMEAGVGGRTEADFCSRGEREEGGT